MSQALDTSKLYLLVEGTETVTLFSRNAEAAFSPAEGTSVAYAKRIVVAQEESGGIGLTVERLPWHLWSDSLAGVVPKPNDVIQDAAGVRWSVERVTPQRFKKRYRLETVKEQ